MDTSVINFLFADDAPEKKEITVDFFENFIKAEAYDVFVSKYVFEELLRTPDESKRNQLLRILDDFPISNIDISETETEIGQLADQYLIHDVIPPKKVYDALHIACTVVVKFDFLVSWNYKHLANVNRERRIIGLNYQLGYIHNFRIITPTELTGYGT
ncbi:MAG: hypothetical protein ACKVTZ_00355 [Bacteroidia bacterium]